MLDYIHLIAGLAGGFVSTLVVHPLDLLKIRHAVNEKYSGLRPALNNYLHSACSIFRERSFIGFYQGITPNLIGSTLAWGLYFAQYNWFKDFLRQWFQLENLSAWHALIAGIYAGNVTLLLTNPVWVAKTRLCLQYENQPKQYRGMIDVLVKLYRMDGIRGLYKGYLPGIKHFGSHEPKASEHLTFAVLSKSFAVLSTYPYQVIRARLQDQHLKYNGIMDAVSRTWRREWLYGFYKGLLPSLLRVTPATCITFLIYEEPLIARHRSCVHKLKFIGNCLICLFVCLFVWILFLNSRVGWPFKNALKSSRSKFRSRVKQKMQRRQHHQFFLPNHPIKRWM
ncbi:Mitochondrial folate transporter/carrier [Trichinella spiralis]|uniref:Mitochondrial folate transporter/carrier n=1 Tax=Trichinella spiralis TaxID=6334 RepID=A0ABR3KEB7_TRISP